jgi:uncharacterized protein YndB with AHSA1/START domain
MKSQIKYQPSGAMAAEVRKDGDKWTLVLVRDLNHSATKVWQALTDPAELHQWAPFDADTNLGHIGTAKLSTVGTPTPQISETKIKRADAPRLLEYTWGGGDIRWQLEPLGKGTRLTLWHNIGHRFIAMGAAGWHICFDVLDLLLAGEAVGRLVAGDALKYAGWQRLNEEYSRQFGIEPMNPQQFEKRNSQ